MIGFGGLIALMGGVYWNKECNIKIIIFSTIVSKIIDLFNFGNTYIIEIKIRQFATIKYVLHWAVRYTILNYSIEVDQLLSHFILVNNL